MAKQPHRKTETTTATQHVASYETGVEDDLTLDVSLSAEALEAPHSWEIPYPSWQADEILPGLYMGGTEDNDTVADAKPLPPLGVDRAFDAVVTLYAWAQTVGWETEELRYGFGDGYLVGDDVTRVQRAAAWAFERWKSGDRVLIRCQAGLNRSGLVTALVLMHEGWHPAEAILHIRDKRSPHALFNQYFVRWLVNVAPEAMVECQEVSAPC